jgi:tRNA uridine 5-carboxymethylaminomethyl modification enzyme
MTTPYHVLVIGGGHAGTEAACLAARMGARTLLITQSIETIGQMSCNPAIGGIAKGTVAREVDALGGIMGRATDRACIQFRMLNRSKGPAVWSPRAQCDRGLYRRAVRALLERQPMLEIVQGTVAGFILDGGNVAGVTTLDGRRYDSATTIVTAGTFLRGRIHMGTQVRLPAGRAGDQASFELAEALEQYGLRVERFKTGTPPRIDGRTVDFTRLVRQDGDTEPYWFSFHERAAHPAQVPCWLTWAGAEVREIILENLEQSALYGGAISGRGPRYCPSVEDKIVKFPDADRHQIFLEPEGLETSEMYVNGLSTSLPPDVQLNTIHAVPGLERARMTRPGYAIEYDYFPPTQLSRTLELREIPGLFLAGQINGTTGYEEAAGQGAVAGINAAARALGREPLVLNRDEAFIGTLIDDLVSRGVDEPYRLFTSRSEYRLLLRQDNAMRRLLPVTERYGLLSDDESRTIEGRMRREEEVLVVSRETAISPAAANPILAQAGSKEVASPIRVAELAKRPGVELRDLLFAAGRGVEDGEERWAELEIKYGGYLERERTAATRLREMEAFPLPSELPYQQLRALSYEARQKLDLARPESLGQAGRIPGVSPADLQALVLEVVKLRTRDSGHGTRG